MKNKSIRYYFFTSITAVLIFGMIVMGLIQTAFYSAQYMREKQAELNATSAVMAQSLRYGSLVPDEQSERTLDFINQTTTNTIVVIDANGKVVYSIGAQKIQNGVVFPDDIMQILQEDGAYEVSGRMSGLFERERYNAGVPVLDGEKEEVKGYVFTSAPIENMQGYLADMLFAFLVASVLAILAASILALLLYRHTITPIKRVAYAAHRFGEGDYSARVPVYGSDELARLALTFNEMANSFEAIDLSRRNFMGNIAHELRTPMTGIKGFVDGMLDGVIPKEDWEYYLGIVSEEVGRLARMTKNMLDISRIEAGEYEPNIVEFDVRDVAVKVFLGAEQRLNDKSVQVKGLEGEPAIVRADKDFVHQVLFNLVDNAIKFVDEGGEIALRIYPERTSVVVAIYNTGAGISAQELPHVFGRFYKADTSRTTSVKGVGLGLHISKVLITQINGRIWAQSEEGKWAEFKISLPAPRKGK